MLLILSLSLLMDILHGAIDGFTLHPLDADSTLPALTDNKTENGFPGSAVLTLSTFWLKTKATEVPSRQNLLTPSPPLLLDIST